MKKRLIIVVATLMAGLCLGAFFLPKRSALLATLTTQGPIAKADAVVLLGGTYRERVPAVAMLYTYGFAPLVILANDGVFSRWSRKHQRNLYNIEWAEEALVELGVPRDHIVKLPFYGSSTINDAIAVKKFLEKQKLQQLIVVTSDYHSRRALWVFNHMLGVSELEIYLYPIQTSGIGLKTLLLERLKLVFYQFRYGVLGIIPDATEIELKGQ